MIRIVTELVDVSSSPPLPMPSLATIAVYRFLSFDLYTLALDIIETDF